MPAEPPRNTIHVVQHLLLDGFRILRAQVTPDIADEEMYASLDRAIEALSPIEGMPIRPNAARLYALAHGLRTIVEDIQPYVASEPVDTTEFPAILKRVEDALLAQRADQLAAMEPPGA